MSGAKRDLGCGFSGYVSRGCIEMPHPEYISSAVKFVAIKEYYEPSHGAQSNTALIQLSELKGGTDHVLAAKHVGDSGQLGTALAHMSLSDFMQDTNLDCADALVIVRDLALGLDSLHTIGLVHGDLQARNVLVGPGGYVIADIDGNQEGSKRDLSGKLYSKSLDIEDFHYLLGDIFAKVVTTKSDAASLDFTDMLSGGAGYRSGGNEEAHANFTALLSTEFSGLVGDTSHAERALTRLSEAMSSLQLGIHGPATLVDIASLADQLIRFLNSPVSLNHSAGRT